MDATEMAMNSGVGWAIRLMYLFGRKKMEDESENIVVTQYCSVCLCVAWVGGQKISSVGQSDVLLINFRVIFEACRLSARGLQRVGATDVAANQRA
jgi:hypothetical protein